MRINGCVREARENALKLFICRESVHETINKYDDIVIDMAVGARECASACVRLCMRYTYFPVSLTLAITTILVWQCTRVTSLFFPCRSVSFFFNWSCCGFITRIINVMDFHITKAPGFTPKWQSQNFVKYLTVKWTGCTNKQTNKPTNHPTHRRTNK